MIRRDPQTNEQRRVPVAWEALEDAFENNAPEVHSYLHTETGEVIRIVDGVADPSMHHRVMSDPQYLRIEPVSSREQYRWMERFIDTVDEEELKEKLLVAIDGKGAFRRFKDVLMNFPVDRERWFTFRSERLRSCMETWLETHGIEAVERPQWRVPTAEEVRPQVERQEEARPVERDPRVVMAETARARVRELVETIPVRDLHTALAFLEFLRDRRHTPRAKTRSAAPTEGARTTKSSARPDELDVRESSPPDDESNDE